MPDTCRGVGVGVGIVVAPLVRMGRPPALPAAQAVVDPGAEAERARKALAAVSADLAARSQEAKDATAATILDALSMIADDPDLTDQVDGLIDDRTDAPHALHQAIEGYRAMLTEAGGYMAERAQDLADIRDRAVAVALGLPMPGVPDPGHPFVLAAEDLRFFEVFNGHPSVRNYGDATHSSSERLWDVVLALRLVEEPAIVEGLRVGRVQLDRHVVVGERQVELALLPIDAAAPDIGGGIVRVDLDGAAVIGLAVRGRRHLEVHDELRSAHRDRLSSRASSRSGLMSSW